jgi:predicted amino acid racemase
MKVDEIVYLGSRVRLAGSSGTGHRIVLDIRNAEKVRVGDVVPITLDPQKLHVLNREDS